MDGSYVHSRLYFAVKPKAGMQVGRHGLRHAKILQAGQNTK
jgi:hypothetical protein